MFILGDIGNTEIKIFIINNSYKVKKKIILKTNILNEKYLISKLSFLKEKNYYGKFNKVLFSSVVPNAFIKIKKILIRKFKIISVLELKKLI